MIQIEQSDREGVPVVSVSGTIDMYSSSELKERLDGHVGQKAARVVVDLEGIDFIDSSGLATLVDAQRHMKAYSGRLQLAALPTRVEAVVRLMHLTKVFEIHSTVDEALSA